MDHPSNAAAGLNAITKHDEQANTVRIDVRGSLSQASRPSLVQMIHELRSTGVESHISVDLAHAARVESTALAGLREDLNAAEGAPGTTGGGVSLVLTGEAAAGQPEDTANAGLIEMPNGFEDRFAASSESGSEGSIEQSSLVLPAGPLEEYSDDQLFAASDAVFSLLDDPGTVGGPDLLGRYNDIGQEIVRRVPPSELLNPAAEPQAAN